MLYKTTTGYIKAPYNTGDCRILEDYLSTQDPETEKYIPFGFIVHDNVLYLPNINIEQFLKPLNEEKVVTLPANKYQSMSRHYMANVPPRDTAQENVIAFITGQHPYKENIDQHQLGILLGTGGGKEQPYSTKIPTPTGITLMGDLNVGDKVFDRNGKPTTVTGIFEQGVKDVYYIKFKDKRVVECGLEHLWEVYDADMNMSVITLGEILKDYKLSDGTRKYRVPTNGVVEYAKQIVPLDPRRFGTRVAKGYYSHIPDCYVFNDVYTRRTLIQGIIDVIKSPYYRRGRQPASKVILYQIQYILWSLGVDTLLHETDEHIDFDFPNFDGAVPTTRDGLTIEEIGFVRQERCRCIMVDNPEHLYLTEDFIVTHNTFSTIYSVTDLCVKTLVVTHMTKIKKQWIDTFTEKFDYTRDKMMELTSNSLESASGGKDFDKDIYFVNHQTINRWIANMSPTQLNKVMINLGIGVKVIDEYHLHFRNSLILDMFTNVDKTVYLTATFDRSDRQESMLFQRITSQIVTYGNNVAPSEDEKHVVYHPVHYTTKCPYRVVKSLGSGYGMGMKKWLFADWTFFDDPDNTTNKIIFFIIDKCLIKEGRILITTPAIKSCEYLCNVIQGMYPNLQAGVISSKNTDKKNEIVKESCRIIVSTIQSAGTGVDIKGLRYVINVEPFSSKVTAKQFMGRLRPYFGSDGEQKATYLFDLVDKSIIFCTAYFKGRTKMFTMLAHETTPLEM